MALGGTVAGQAIADAGLRRLATEIGGPRPGGTRSGETRREGAEGRTARAAKP